MCSITSIAATWKRIEIAFFLALLSLATSCGERAPNVPAQINKDLLPVPLVRQSTHYSCGAASLLSLLIFWNADDDAVESSLFVPLKTTEKEGTDSLNMEKFLREKGLQVTLKEHTTIPEISEAIRRREPVIVDYQAWPDKPVSDYSSQWENGHYSVVVGVDQVNLYLMDPSISGGYAYLPIADFLTRWHDYENRDGKRVESHGLAIFVQGKTAIERYPREMRRVQ